MTTQSLITFRHVRKDLAGRRLFDIPELAIHTGQCVILTGDNGTGKTTLLKVLAGLESPDRADVSYNGHSLPWQQACRHYRRDVVYVHQAPYLFDRTVHDNVAYSLRQSSLSRAQIKAKVSDTLKWAGLGHLAQRNARRLSGGEKQRVALARARILEPRLLLLDEPTASLDYESRERTYFLIQRLKSEGIAVVIASHELHRIATLGDVHMHLDQGKLHRHAVPGARTHEQSLETEEGVEVLHSRTARNDFVR
ncbi:MAG: energy-coupling factor ABC transporter ATP-binding protein [Acidiferrobacterales bacterium]